MAYLVELFIAGAFIFSCTLLMYVRWAHTYWTRKKVPHLNSTTTIYGNMENPFRPRRGLKYDIKDAYDEFKSRGLPHGGIYLFTRPIYVPVDTELIKNIFSRDFPYFIGHGLPYDQKKDPLSAHLFNLDGEEWRNMRVKLTPTFTSGKMRSMFGTLLACSAPMMETIDAKMERGEALDIKEILACYSTDVIGSCAFGLECNSFKEPNAEFRKYGRQVFTVSARNKALDFMRFVLPSLAKLVYIRSVTADLEQFFIKAIRGVLDYRTQSGVARNDFMQIFLEMQKRAKANSKESLSLEEIAAQAFVFFLAGFETSATTMTFCLHEMAFNQDIQDKLRDEIGRVLEKHDGKLTYDAVMEMRYLDEVINETLRKYPPVPFIMRECNKDYDVPNTKVTLDAGCDVFISVLGIHRDPEYYPDPDKFEPERFTDENRRKRPPFTFLPFGEGPRICIGARFGLMQAKTGLCSLLNRYKFLPARGENYDIDFEPTLILLTKKGKVMLNVKKISRD